MKILSRIKSPEVVADENPKERFERDVIDFLRAAQNKGILEVNGPISNPRYKEIRDESGTWVAIISVKAMLIDYQTIRNLYMQSGRFDIEVAAIQWVDNRWACIRLQRI